MLNEFIVTITEHRILGHILMPYVIKPNDHGAFYTIVSPVVKKDVDESPELFTDIQKELVNLIDKYSDENLARKFSRKLGSKAFFENIDDNFFNEHITPFIDKKVIECLNIIRANNVKLFIKPSKYNNIYDEDRIQLTDEFAKPLFHFSLETEGLKYHISIKYKGKPLSVRFKQPLFITDFPCRLVLNNELISFEKIAGKRLKPFLQKEFISIPQNVTEKYLKSFVRGIVKDHEVVADGFDVINIESDKKAILAIEVGLDFEPLLILYFQYASKKFKHSQKGIVDVDFKNKNGRYVFEKHTRNIDWEKQVIDCIKEKGLRFISDRFECNSSSVYERNQYALVDWLNANKEYVESKGIIIEQKISPTKFFLGKQTLKVNVKTEGDWFDIYAEVTFGDYKTPFIRLKRYILSGKREFILPNGDIAILPAEWFVKYKSLLPFSEGDKEHLRFSKHHFNLIKETIVGIDEDILTKIKLMDPKSFQLYEAPDGLNATMRDYQKEGYSWIRSLINNKFGGCLADDMGLGKTIQTLAVLLYIKNSKSSELISDLSAGENSMQLFAQQTKKNPASLIIMPTSLIHNWQNEIKKFTPQLKFYKHIGSKRKKITNLKAIVDFYDVIVTTYGTIRNDFELFRELLFSFIILDESQYIKNAASKTYKAVSVLKSEHKLVLTGTPIENSLSDLWSQLNFLNRGLLGNIAFFNKEFIQPIEKKNDEDKQKELLRLISPFILRRTKIEVAKDLPALTEQIRYCKMSDQQEEIYEKEKSAIRNKLIESIETKGIEKSSILVLQGLTRMRQLANHPALVKINDAESGKFIEVIRSLENLMAEKHKVLIFSSFVTHLELFRSEFEKRKWCYCFLSGQTRDRETVIKDFQEKEQNRIFLISLKAGGVGLNLTSADYIFILDPWWNPATENQAINRAHRIGQDKKVFVYRFITEDSIEEKIQTLKERKLELADKIIQSNNPLKLISTDEIIGLFS